MEKSTGMNLDLPEAIQVRKQFFDETRRYKMIAKSVFDYSWIDDVKTNQSVLIIAEGILMYFEENEVKNLINTMGESLAASEMFLEITSSNVVERNKKHENTFQKNAPFKWGIKNINEIEKFNKQIKVLNEWNYFDYHKDRREDANLTLKREFSSRIVHLKFN